MDRAPRGSVTRRTVAATCKVLTISAVCRYKKAAAKMTVGTGIMRVRCGARKRIIMTARTVAGCLHQTRMVYSRMRRLPT